MLEPIVRMVGSMTATVLVAWLACFVLRKAPATCRSAIWRSALLLVLVIPVLSLVWQALPALRCEVTVSLPRVSSRTAPVTYAPEVASGPAFVLPEAPPTVAAVTAEPMVARRDGPHIPLSLAIVGLWALGAALAVSLVVRDGLRLRSLCRRATPVMQPALVDRAEGWAQRVGLRRPPTLTESALVQLPVVTGWQRPTLILPGDMPDGPSHLDAILVHELAHIRRHDVLFQYLAQVARALWWWHPLAWLLAREVTATAEEACDDWAISLTGDVHCYAESVVRWAETARAAGALACGWRGATLARRVRRILGGPSIRNLRVPRVAAVGIAAVALSIAALSGPLRARAVPLVPGRTLVRLGPAPFADAGRVRLLLVGTDTRPNDAGRADAIMLLSLNPQARRAALLSLPRDTKLDIPGHGAGKLGHSYAFGGMELTHECVERVLGQPVDHHALFDYAGFVEFVDRLGGVWADVPDIEGRGRGMNYDEGVRVLRTHIDHDGCLHLHLKPGIQKLDGAGALGFVRYRKSTMYPGLGDSDVQRCARQQQFLAALMRQCSQADPARLVGALRKARGHLATDLSWDETYELLRILRGSDSGTLWTGTAPVTYAFESDRLYARLDPAGLRAQLQEIDRHLDVAVSDPSVPRESADSRETTSIRGRVLLPDGVAPAVGARVTAERVYQGREGRQHPPAVYPQMIGLKGLESAPQTAEDGTFEITLSRMSPVVRLKDAPAGTYVKAIDEGWGRYVVRVHMPGYAPARSELVAPEGQTQIVLQRGQVWRGTVTDHEGRPMPGIHVGAYWPTFRGAAQETGEAAGADTGADGRFELGPLAAGEYDIWAKADDQAPMSAFGVRLPRPEGQELHLRLQAPAEVRGRVVYLGTRDPVEGVQVSLYMFDAGLSRNATSGPDGRFTLRGIRPGEHTVRLRRDGAIRVSHGTMRIDRDGHMEVLSGEVSGGQKLADGDISIALSEGQVLERDFPTCEGGIIEGRVLTADGEPVPGASVGAGHAIKSNLPDYTPESYLRTNPVSFQSQQAATTDAEGRFRVEKLWPRHYFLHAKGPDGHYGATEFFEVTDRAVTTVEVTIGDATFPPFPKVPDALRERIYGRERASAEVRGRVVYLDTGRPVKGVRVSVSGTASPIVTSQSDGTFVLDGLPAGQVVLRLVKPGGFRDGEAAVTGEVLLSLEEEQVLERTFRICEGGALSVRVLNEARGPLPDALVNLGRERQARPGRPHDPSAGTHLGASLWFFSSVADVVGPDGVLRFASVWPGGDHYECTAGRTNAEGALKLDHIWPGHYHVTAVSAAYRCWAPYECVGITNGKLTEVELVIPDHP